MDLNKLRRLAGLETLTEAKKKPALDDDLPPMDDDVPPEADPKDKKKDEEEDDYPKIVHKIAKNAAKKFGIGDPKGGPSDDLDFLEELLMKVYEAGVKDGEKGGSKKAPKKDAGADDMGDESALEEAKKWSGEVAEKKHPPEDLFAKGSVAKIVSWLKDNHSELKSAMSSLNFYINRAGKNLAADRKAELEGAKEKLRKAFGE